ncbi:MAG: 4a-hydroxytetrahydrobiopterin dehydratase [Acidimicrobiia bacterium]
MKPLADAEITAALVALAGWARAGDEIVKTFDCDTFAGAITFVVHIGFLAEQADHHPDIDVRWRHVRVALTTHSAHGLTKRDLDLAAEIEGIGA